MCTNIFARPRGAQLPPIWGSTARMGRRVLRDLEVRRAILARELALEEIAGIVEEVPELDYEVFVHGAMCYSISGMCLASGLLLGRSGNRGVCAQVCRTWQEGPRGEGYYFSLRHLARGSGCGSWPGWA